VASIRVINLDYATCLVTSNDNTTFEQLFREDLSNILSVSIDDVIVTSLSPGSIIVDVIIITNNPSKVVASLNTFLESNNATFPILNQQLPSTCFAPGKLGQAQADPSDSTSQINGVDTSSNGWKIAVGVVVVVVVLAALALAIAYYVRRQRRDKFLADAKEVPLSKF